MICVCEEEETEQQREREDQETEEGKTDGERKKRVMKVTCWEIQTEPGWQGQTDRKLQQKGNVKVHFTVVTQCCLAVSTPGVQSKHQDLLIVTFFVSLCLLFELKVSAVGRNESDWEDLGGKKTLSRQLRTKENTCLVGLQCSRMCIPGAWVI